MIQFGHKNITNPTITHIDKVMNVIADCVNDVQGFADSGNKIEVKDLKQLVNLTKRAVAHNLANMNAKASNAMAHSPGVQPVPRMPMLTNSNAR